MRSYAPLKRAIDIIGSALLLIPLIPVGCIAALCIALDTPGPILFVQTRIGKGGAPFRILKFRSMVENAPALGSYLTLANDPRITRSGRILRRTSIDELPQIWNVLTGDMSLVGPRPETPAQQELYTPEDWQLRHRVRPGITGLAQVSGRSDLSVEERLRCDLRYAENPSLRGDIDIIVKTAMQLLRKTGVN